MLQRALVRSVRTMAGSSATRSGLPILLHKQLKLKSNQKNTTIINSIKSDDFVSTFRHRQAIFQNRSQINNLLSYLFYFFPSEI